VHCKRFLRKTFDALVAAHGLTESARKWAEDRAEASRREGYFNSNAFKNAHEAQHEHYQQFRPVSRQNRNSRGTTHLGHSAYLVTAVGDNGDEHKILRTFLPAFHVLPGVAPAEIDDTMCARDFCDIV
jgi:hypothetical protein